MQNTKIYYGRFLPPQEKNGKLVLPIELLSEEVTTPNNNIFETWVQQAINLRTKRIIAGEIIVTQRTYSTNKMTYKVNSIFNANNSKTVQTALKKLMQKEVESNE